MNKSNQQDELNEAEFIKQFTQVTEYIIDILDTQKPDLETEITDQMLSIETENGIFLINRQLILKEIWLSSPISGPYHFKYDNNHEYKWINHDKITLFNILSKELNITLYER